MEGSNDCLIHYGVLGMKWGVRKQKVSKEQKQANKQYKKDKKELLKSYRKDKGPKRFKSINAANSAARSHFRSDRTRSFSTYRDQKSKAERKEARLTSDQVKNGRYRVARARSIKRNVGSVAVGSLVGSVIFSAGAASLPALLAAVGGTSAAAIGSHYISGAHYYGKQRKAYGGTRAKYALQKKKKS